jgi:hypothetical protein
MKMKFHEPIFILLFALFTAATCQAQEPLGPPPLPSDPTPLEQLLSGSEKQMLGQADDAKERVEVYLKISDAHLDAAYSAINGSDTAKAERELDIYNKTIAEAAKVAFSIQNGKRKASKKIEQHIYKQLRTLESIERAFPNERIAFAEDAIKRAKQVRVQAINEAFASGDVLKDPSEEKKQEKDSTVKEGRPKNSNTPPPMSFTGARVSFRSQIPGDYLNEEEDDFVRRAQKADDRAKVFMKIADRRLLALTGGPPPPTDDKSRKKAEEEERKWGAMPKLSRVELLRHYTRAIDEVIAKLEDAHERNPKSAEIPKALATVRDATDRHLQILKPLVSEMKDEREARALSDAITQAEMANKGAREGLKGK